MNQNQLINILKNIQNRLNVVQKDNITLKDENNKLKHRLNETQKKLLVLTKNTTKDLNFLKAKISEILQYLHILKNKIK